MRTMANGHSTPAPDLVGALAHRAQRANRLEAPELVDIIGAILDRADVAGVDERARLLRSAGKLERELAARLAE
jgi:hypothetical protein